MSSQKHPGPHQTEYATISQTRLNDVYQAFTRSERRQLLAALANAKQGITLEPSEMTEGRWIELYHVHLPKLEDAELIEWNTENNVIAKGPRFEGVQPLFTVMYDNVDRPDEV
ncbi:MAG: DUF7344 domain-containing protein [Halobacteriota archaeon]